MELHLSVIMCKTESCWLKKFIWRKSIAYSRRHYIRNQRAYYRLLLEEIVTAAGFTTNILDLIYYTWTTNTQKIFTSLAVDKYSSFTNFTSLKDHAVFTWKGTHYAIQCKLLNLRCECYMNSFKGAMLCQNLEVSLVFKTSSWNLQKFVPSQIYRKPFTTERDKVSVSNL